MHNRIYMVILILFFVFTRNAIAQNWDFLIDEENNQVGVRDISNLGDGDFAQIMQFNLLEGFLPEGKDLGYKKRVGARVRHIIFRCDSPVVRVSGLWVRDMGLNIIEKLEAVPIDSITPIARDSDAALFITTNYVCGDNTVKTKAPQLAQKKPNDLVTLVCNFDNDEFDYLYEVSYSEKTVNGLPAIIDEKSIMFNIQGKNGEWIIAINRYTGQYNVKSAKSGSSVYGKCKTQSGPKF